MALNYSKVELSNENFEATVELCELDDSWLEKPIFPSDETLAMFSFLVYKHHLFDSLFTRDKVEALVSGLRCARELKNMFKNLDQPLLDNYHENAKRSIKNIIHKWELLTTAQNKKNGYFGAMFWNSEDQQLVISHRDMLESGPDPVTTVNQRTSQMDTACSFVAHALRILSNKVRSNQMQISITGHSLGAWLAQVTAFSTEYLAFDHQTNQFRARGQQDIPYHVHCVGFQSPGSRPALTQLTEAYDLPYQDLNRELCRNLDITVYSTRPDISSTLYEPVGKVYLIPATGSLRTSMASQDELYYHSIESILMKMMNGAKKCIVYPPKNTFSDENQAVECDLNVFSEVEQAFLFSWQNINTSEVNDKNIVKREIEIELPNLDLKKYDQLLTELFLNDQGAKIELNIIKYKTDFSIDKLVNFTKQLFRFFENAEKFVQNLSQNAKATSIICKKFSENYLQREDVRILKYKFNDVFSLFLRSEDEHFLLISTRFKLAIQRVYSTLHFDSEYKEKRYFLDLVDLVHLNAIMHLPQIVESLNDHVLVLNCQQEKLDEKQLEILTSLLQKTRTFKVIVVVQSEIHKLVENILKDNFIIYLRLEEPY